MRSFESSAMSGMSKKVSFGGQYSETNKTIGGWKGAVDTLTVVSLGMKIKLFVNVATAAALSGATRKSFVLSVKVSGATDLNQRFSPGDISSKYCFK